MSETLWAIGRSAATRVAAAAPSWILRTRYPVNRRRAGLYVFLQGSPEIGGTASPSPWLGGVSLAFINLLPFSCTLRHADWQVDADSTILANVSDDLRWKLEPREVQYHSLYEIRLRRHALDVADALSAGGIHLRVKVTTDVQCRLGEFSKHFETFFWCRVIDPRHFLGAAHRPATINPDGSPVRSV